MSGIANDMVVTLLCDMCDIDGMVLKQAERVTYLHGGYDGVLPALEKILEGKELGDVVSLDLPPEDAEGEYNAALVRVEPRTAFPHPPEIGSFFQGGEMPTYDEQNVEYRVVAIDGDEIILDGNHPLAGKTLRLLCTVVDVRKATEAELIVGAAE